MSQKGGGGGAPPPLSGPEYIVVVVLQYFLIISLLTKIPNGLNYHSVNSIQNKTKLFSIDSFLYLLLIAYFFLTASKNQSKLISIDYFIIVMIAVYYFLTASRTKLNFQTPHTQYGASLYIEMFVCVCTSLWTNEFLSKPLSCL